MIMKFINIKNSKNLKKYKKGLREKKTLSTKVESFF